MEDFASFLHLQPLQLQQLPLERQNHQCQQPPSPQFLPFLSQASTNFAVYDFMPSTLNANFLPQWITYAGPTILGPLTPNTLNDYDQFIPSLLSYQHQQLPPSPPSTFCKSYDQHHQKVFINVINDECLPSTTTSGENNKNINKNNNCYDLSNLNTTTLLSNSVAVEPVSNPTNAKIENFLKHSINIQQQQQQQSRLTQNHHQQQEALSISQALNMNQNIFGNSSSGIDSNLFSTWAPSNLEMSPNSKINNNSNIIPLSPQSPLTSAPSSGSSSPTTSFINDHVTSLLQQQQSPVSLNSSSIMISSTGPIRRARNVMSINTLNTLNTAPSSQKPSALTNNSPTTTTTTTTTPTSSSSSSSESSSPVRPQFSYSGPPKSYYSRLPLYDRPFKCDQCPQSFNRNHDLKRHKRIHLAVKPYPCSFCEKQFSRKDALKRHILVKGCDNVNKASVNKASPAAAKSPTSNSPTVIGEKGSDVQRQQQ
ncbi:hypothetical protein G9A89_021024 [Geosiphon pyriformis]|nr:hypothetical protein G9A89_021024 [Geosiphon pyriformis]